MLIVPRKLFKKDIKFELEKLIKIFKKKSLKNDNNTDQKHLISDETN